MLRAIVLVLLLANLGFYAWREGWLAPLHGVIGARPEGDREPERLAQQIRAEAVRLIPSEAASTAGRAAAPSASAPVSAPASAPASAPTSSPGTDAGSVPQAALTACLEAGPYSPYEAALAETHLKTVLRNGGWIRRDLGSTWWVAMGPYETTELLVKKRAELRRRGVAPDTSPYRAGGSPVLVISRHDSQAAAESALTAWTERGVRSGRVLPVGIAQTVLRVAQADAQTQGVLAALSTDKLRGRSFAACPEGT